MPRNAKFNKEEIILKAIEIVECQGMEFLTARSLGECLGSSARPIFTTFDSMDDVINGVNQFANNLYQSYVKVGLQEEIAFKGVGMAYIKFAKEHPNLFKLLFMKQIDTHPNTNNVLGIIEDSYQDILNSITEHYGVSNEFAKELYLDMWIFSHGIATLIANKMCELTEEEISNRLNMVCKSLIMLEVKK